MPEQNEMVDVGLLLLQAIRDDGLSKAAAARKLNLSLMKARFRIAAARRFLMHPRNKNHPQRELLKYC